MRVDENTKEVLQTWPLTRVRRWAATANLFTLVGSFLCLIRTKIRQPLLLGPFLPSRSCAKVHYYSLRNSGLCVLMNKRISAYPQFST